MYSHRSSGDNSLDENAIASHSPDDSLDGSAGRESGGSSASTTTNDKQALCRGLAVGRVTPQNITLPQNINHITISHNNKNNINIVKKLAPKPPQKPPNSVAVGAKQAMSAGSHARQPSHSKLSANGVTSKPIAASNQRSISNVYIESYSPSNHNNIKTFANNSQQIHSNYNNNNINNNHTLNQLSLMNLETTEL